MRELSKKVHKFSKAEQFVFISEQSAQFFVKFSINPLQQNSFRRPISTEVNKQCYNLTLYVETLGFGEKEALNQKLLLILFTC